MVQMFWNPLSNSRVEQSLGGICHHAICMADDVCPVRFSDGWREALMMLSDILTMRCRDLRFPNQMVILQLRKLLVEEHGEDGRWGPGLLQPA